jgi:hypothetical protein
MLFAQLATKCSEKNRSKKKLGEFSGRSPKNKTPLQGAAFTFTAAVTPVTPSP